MTLKLKDFPRNTARTRDGKADETIPATNECSERAVNHADACRKRVKTTKLNHPKFVEQMMKANQKRFEPMERKAEELQSVTAIRAVLGSQKIVHR